MEKNLLTGLIAGGLAVTALGAFAGYRMLDRPAGAEMASATQATTSTGKQRMECHDEVVTRTRPTQDPNQVAGTVAGAIVGGVIGNQVGGGNGKKLATVGGAVGGGYAGNKIQENMQAGNTYQETQQVCSPVPE